MTPEQQKQFEQEAKTKSRYPAGSVGDTVWKFGYIAGRTVSAEKIEQLEAEVARLTKMMEDDLKRQVRLNRPGASEQVQEEVWQNFKTKNNIQ